MARIITIQKVLSYDLDRIMKMRNCDYDTAIEIAYNYFDEEEAEAFEEITEIDND